MVVMMAVIVQPTVHPAIYERLRTGVRGRETLILVCSLEGASSEVLLLLTGSVSEVVRCYDDSA